MKRILLKKWASINNVCDRRARKWAKKGTIDAIIKGNKYYVDAELFFDGITLVTKENKENLEI